MTTTERLLAAAEPIWEQYYTHPFVRGIGDGTLDHNKFRYYIMQDYKYLNDYARVFAIGIAKATDLETMTMFGHDEQSIFEVEQDIHQGYMGKFGVTQEELDATPMALNNLSYTSYMIRIAYEGGAGEVAAAILSCALSYEAIAKRLLEENPNADKDPFYGEWVSMYSGQMYCDGNVERIALIERLTKDYTEEQLRHLEEIFVACSRYELDFWDMGWEMRK